MLAQSTLSYKFQTTIPKAIVKRLGIKPSDRITYQCEGPLVIMRTKKRLLKDCLPYFPKKENRVVALEEIQEAIEQGGEPW